MSKSVVASVLLAGVLGVMGYKGFALLQEKAQQQESATEVVQRWVQSYQALAASTAAWSSRYPDISKFDDLLSMFRSIRLDSYGLRASPDDLSVQSLDAVVYNGVPVGLARVCLASSDATGGGGFRVYANTYSELLAGLRRLAARKDLEISTLVVQGGGSEEPSATLGGFCMLLRNEVKS